MTYRVLQADDGSKWLCCGSKQAGVTGYLEVFFFAGIGHCSIPGKSRWIEGPEFDLARAKISND